MSKDDLQIGQGDITFFIDGEQVTLKPCLHAVKVICAHEGGIAGMLQRCAQLDFNAIQTVIVAGLGLSGDGAKELPEKLYKSGLFKMSSYCIAYLNVLSNGGKPVKEGGSTDDPQVASR